MHPILKQIAEAGQSIWYDSISRKILESGEMRSLIEDGVVGVTSNPTIFEQAITGSSDYDEQIGSLAAEGRTAEQIYDVLTMEDIAATADLFQPVYERSGGRDGYVSIEVNPNLAYDTQATIAEARRIFHALGRPNVMIKIPGTQEGLAAIETAIGEGINVNVTLIFSVEVYRSIMQAYLGGLERFTARGGDPAKVASVASFFVSRVDSLVDTQIQNLPELADLLGKVAIANSKLAYQQFLGVFSGKRFKVLESKGARVQRPLWASTSAKNPRYSPTLYVDNLIGPRTVNTMPPVTLDAIRSGVKVGPTITQALDEARETIARVERAGVCMQTITDQLRTAGVDAFAASFNKLIVGIEARRLEFAAR